MLGLRLFLVSVLLFFVGCNLAKKPKDTREKPFPKIQEIGIRKGKLVLKGLQLDTITGLALVDGEKTVPMHIETQRTLRVQATAAESLTLLLGTTLDLLVETAEASEVIPIVIEIPDGSLDFIKLKMDPPTAGNILVYDGETWAPQASSAREKAVFYDALGIETGELLQIADDGYHYARIAKVGVVRLNFETGAYRDELPQIYFPETGCNGDKMAPLIPGAAYQEFVMVHGETGNPYKVASRFNGESKSFYSGGVCTDASATQVWLVLQPILPLPDYTAKAPYVVIFP